jgi:hypothetical protein
MSRYVHTYNYKKLINGTRPYKNIRLKFWLWGFGFTYESKTKLMGFALNSRDIRDIKKK